MRNTIRRYAFALSLVAALAVPASATSQTATEPDDYLTKIKNLVILVFDDAKIYLPPG
jgi:hypothetical protein